MLFNKNINNKKNNDKPKSSVGSLLKSLLEDENQKFYNCSRTILDFFSKKNLSSAMVEIKVSKNLLGYNIKANATYIISNGAVMRADDVINTELYPDLIPSYVKDEIVNSEDSSTIITLSASDLEDLYNERDLKFTETLSFVELLNIFKRINANSMVITDRVFYTNVILKSIEGSKSFNVAIIKDIPEDIKEALYPFKSIEYSI